MKKLKEIQHLGGNKVQGAIFNDLAEAHISWCSSPWDFIFAKSLRSCSCLAPRDPCCDLLDPRQCLLERERGTRGLCYAWKQGGRPNVPAVCSCHCQPHHKATVKCYAWHLLTAWLHLVGRLPSVQVDVSFWGDTLSC